MTPIEARVDWEGVKRCLAILHLESRVFLSRSLLIGGAACWFYKVQLQKAHHPTFQTDETQSTHDLWLSKDVDFTGIFRGDAFELLPRLIATDPKGNRFLNVAGIRLGFAQVGVTFDPEEAFQRARGARFTDAGEEIQFLVMDPVTLYREKQALAQKRNQPNDHAHFQLLREYLTWEVLVSCEAHAKAVSVSEQRRYLAFILDVNGRVSEILQDQRLASHREMLEEFLP